MIYRLPGHGKMETTARDSAQEAAGRVAESIAGDMLQCAGRNSRAVFL